MSYSESSRRLTRALFVSAVCAGLVLGCKKADEATPEPTVVVQAAHPTRGPIAEQIVADAILAPLSQAAITSRITAPIRAEYVQRGAHVHRGQLLVRLDDRDLQANATDSSGAVLSASAALRAATQATIPEEVKKAQADAAQQKVALDVAHKTTQERQNLFTQGALSGRDLDTAIAAEAQAKAAYDTAVTHVEAVTRTTRLTDEQSAQGQLTSAKGRLQNAQAQASFAALRSPIDGIVTDRPFFPGETPTQGAPLITVMDTSYLLARVHLSQSSAQQLALGNKASVTIPGIDHPVDATVSFISPALDPGSTTAEVWLRLPNPSGQFKVGTPVHAVISGKSVADAIQIPSSAILPGAQADLAVLVIAPDGTAHRKPVTIGIRTSTTAQVLSGLSPADNVITEGGYGLDEGTKVKLGSPADTDSSDDKDKS